MALPKVGLEVVLEGVQAFESNTKKVNQGAEAAGKAFDAAAKAAEAAGLKFDQASGRWRTAGGQFASAAQLAAAGVENVGKSAAGTKPKVEGLAGATQKAGQSASSASSGFGRLSSSVFDLGSSISGQVLSSVIGLGQNLLKIGAIAGGAALGGLTAGFVAAGASGLQMNNAMEQASARIQAFTKDSELTAQILEMVRQRAASTPFAFQEMAAATANLLPTARAAGVGLTELISKAEILAASNPAEGLEGAAFALKEAVSGDFTSIIERFNLPRTLINQLKDEGVPALEIVGQAMEQLGLDTDLVSGLAQTAQGRWSTFQDTLQNLFSIATQPIFDSFSSGLGQANDLLGQHSVLLEDVAHLIGSAIGQALSYAGSLFSSFVGDANAYGFNVIDSFAGGMADAIGSVVNTLAYIGDTIASWLAPGSPPKILPDLDEWGTEAADVYLKGWTEADFGIFDELSGQLENALETLVDSGAMGEQDMISNLLGGREAIATAINELKQTGDVSQETFNAILQAAGPAGKEVEALVRSYVNLQKASDGVVKAEAEVAAADEAVQQARLQLLAATDAAAQQQALAAVEAAMAKKKEVVQGLNAAKAAQQAAKNEMANQEQLFGFRQEQQALINRQAELEEEEAEAAKKQAEEDKKAAEARTKAQRDYEFSVADTADKLDILRKELAGTEKGSVEYFAILTQIASLEKQQAQDREEAADASVSGSSRAAGAAKSTARATSQAAKEQERAMKTQQREIERTQDAEFKYQMSITDTAGKIELLKGKLAQTKVGSAEYYEILTQIAALEKQQAKEAEKAAGVPSPIAASLESILGPAGQVGQATTTVAERMNRLRESFGRVLEPIQRVMTALTEFRDKILVPVGRVVGEFVTDHWEEFKGALVGIGAVLAGAAIAAAISAIGGAIAALATPVAAIIAAGALLGAAWQGNWFGIRDVVLPVIDAITTGIGKVMGAFDKFGARGAGVSILGQLGMSPETIGQVMGAVNQIVGGINKVIGAVTKISGAFERFGARGAGVSLLGQLGLSPETISMVMAAFDQIGGAFNQFLANLGPIGPAFQNFIGQITASLPSFITLATTLAKVIGTVLVGAFILWAKVASVTLPLIGTFLADLFTAVTTTLGGMIDFVSGTIEMFAGLFTGDLDRARKGAMKVIEGLVEAILGPLVSMVHFLTKVFEKGLENIFKVWKWLYKVLVGGSIVPDLVKAIVKWIERLVSDWTDLHKTLRKVTEQIWDDISQVIRSVLNSIRDFIRSVMDNIRSVISSAWDAIKRAIDSALDAIKGAIQSAWNSIKQTIEQVMKAIESAIKSAWNAIENTIESALDSIRSAVSSAFNTIRSTISSIMSQVQSNISSAWNSIKNTIGSALDSIRSEVSSAFNSLRSTISSVMNQVISTISSTWNSIVSTIRSKAQEAINAAMNEFNQLPSRISNLASQMVSAATALMNGLVSGINSKIQAVKDALVGAVTGAITTMVSAISSGSISTSLFNAGRSILNKMVDGIRSVTSLATELIGKVSSAISSLVTAVTSGSIASNLFNAGRNIIGGIVEGINDAADQVWDTIRGILEDAVDGAFDFFGIDSPSKLMMGLGANVMEGFRQGLIAMAPTVQTAFQASVAGPISPALAATAAGPIYNTTNVFNTGQNTINGATDEAAFEARVLRVIQRNIR